MITVEPIQHGQNAYKGIEEGVGHTRRRYNAITKVRLMVKVKTDRRTYLRPIFIVQLKDTFACWPSSLSEEIRHVFRRTSSSRSLSCREKESCTLCYLFFCHCARLIVAY